MTPKEKANQLFLKLLTLDTKCEKSFVSVATAKRAATIAVDEMLKQFKKIKVSHIISGYITYKDFEKNLTSIQDQLDSEMISKWNYWNEVKHEIEKL